MGGGKWSDVTYTSSKSLRASKGVADFEYSQQATAETPVHASLDAKRIKSKPFKKLESRDSEEHPNSLPVFVCFDVTGSNFDRAVEAQKRLPNLMTLLKKYVDDPQVLIAANDDVYVVDQKALQISDFESDNRIDERIRDLLLLKKGGANEGESYDLALWAAANRTILDCMEKRGKKGYFFMYADEPIFKTTNPDHIERVFGEQIAHSIPIEQTIAQLKTLYHIFILWPLGGFDHAREQYVKLFGEECVVTLQQPRLICEMIGSLIGMTEGKLQDDSAIVGDLVTVAGLSEADAKLLGKSLVGHRKIVLDSATA